MGYEARALGVSRLQGMRGDDAREMCPDIKLFKVPEVRGEMVLSHMLGGVFFLSNSVLVRLCPRYGLVVRYTCISCLISQK